MANSKFSEHFVSPPVAKPKDSFTKAVDPKSTISTAQTQNKSTGKPAYGSVAWFDDKNSHTDHHW